MSDNNKPDNDNIVMILFRWFILSIILIAGSYIIADYVPWLLRGLLTKLWPLGGLLLGEPTNPVKIAVGMIGVVFVSELRSLIANWTHLAIVDRSGRQARNTGMSELAAGHTIMMLSNVTVTGVLAVIVYWAISKLIPGIFDFGFTKAFGTSFSSITSRFPVIIVALLILAGILFGVIVYIVLRRRRRGRPSNMDIMGRRHAFKLILAFGQWATVTFALIVLTKIGDGDLTGPAAIVVMAIVIILALMAHQALAYVANRV